MCLSLNWKFIHLLVHLLCESLPREMFLLLNGLCAASLVQTEASNFVTSTVEKFITLHMTWLAYHKIIWKEITAGRWRLCAHPIQSYHFVPCCVCLTSWLLKWQETITQIRSELVSYDNGTLLRLKHAIHTFRAIICCHAKFS